jgi:hypothetical protein
LLSCSAPTELSSTGKASRPETFLSFNSGRPWAPWGGLFVTVANKRNPGGE